MLFRTTFVWKICAISLREPTDCRKVKQLNSFSRIRVDGQTGLGFNALRCPDSSVGRAGD
ncbi:hypothetical protein C3709_16475 [Lelliottia aquatilis]|nr:hypothetical protein C3Z09_20855 [Lelliottia aquatilis]POZ18916.1 hypothetical protein C3708_17155 [Lelliottia sp. 7254-16]POZ31775.1 hypothetical protein C3710_16480 [Lelliottia aquatilis]POZ37351.1 hypothetical protein C3709_16475 [Lelliottia aquatilis]